MTPHVKGKMPIKEDKSAEKSKKEQMIDAIVGPDEEIDDASATEILNLYGLTDNDLINSFKAAITRKLNELPPESADARDLGGMLRGVRDHQKTLTGEKLSPKERISRLVDGLLTPPVSASYAFRERKEGELPDSDKQILEDLKKELLERDEGTGE